MGRSRSVAVGLLALAALAVPAAPATAEPGTAAVAPAAASGSVLRPDGGLYPRAVQLPSGEVIAGITAAIGPGPSAIVYSSTDSGASFHEISVITDPAGSSGMCCATLYVLPTPVGALPAGTLLWAGSFGGDAGGGRRMSLRVWASRDAGRSWSYTSTVRAAPNSGGLWEPEFSVDARGRLVCYFSDETRSATHSQLVAEATSTDGVSWSAPTDVVASRTVAHRPGMPTVRRQPDGTYAMTYEVCGYGGRYDCAGRFRTSADGVSWGDPGDIGPVLADVSGRYFTHTPVLAWRAGGQPNGQLLVAGQQLREATGAASADSGATVLVDTEGGWGRYYDVAAPVAVPAPANDFCPNYSPALLPLADGRILGISTAWDGSVCTPYFATGTMGTGDAAGVVDGATYRLVNTISGLCLDISAGSTAEGGNVQQWTCNGLWPQDFAARRDGSGSTLSVRRTGFCVDVADSSAAPGADVWQWTCNGTAAQRWIPHAVGRGYYTFGHDGTDQCLDAAGGSTVPGGDVAQWTCNGLAPQIWHLERR